MFLFRLIFWRFSLIFHASYAYRHHRRGRGGPVPLTGRGELLPSKDAFRAAFAERHASDGVLRHGSDGSDPPSRPHHHAQKLGALQKWGIGWSCSSAISPPPIGDPTDKLAVRKQLTREEVVENSKRFKDQASKVLDFGGENPAELRFNSLNGSPR